MKDCKDRNIINKIEVEKTSTDALRYKIDFANKHYLELMDNASCGFSFHDKSGVILDVNKHALDMFGYSKESLIGKKFQDCIAPSESKYFELQIEKLLLEKKIGPVRVHVTRSNDEVIDVELSSVCIEMDNQTVLLNIINDVTERDRLKKEYVLNDKLITIGTLAAGIIHEINNPLTSVLGNLTYLNKKICSVQLNDDASQKFISQIEEIIKESIDGAEKIREIVKELKGFARVEEFPSATLSNLHDTLESAIKMAYPQFKNIATIEKNYASDVGNLLTNHSKLHQVFLNLIVNAAQAFPNRNNNIIRITTSKEGDNIKIDITDNGTGIPPENMQKIFEPFFTTKPTGVGTGLGLAICRDIIKQVGGEISARSTLGQGTTFSICLPSHLQVFSAPHANNILNKVTARSHILVIDDEPMLLAMMKRFLEKTHVVTTASGGLEAFKLLQIQPMLFNIIISDLNMPDVDGADIYRYVSNNFPGLEKAMIFTTGGSFRSSTDEFLASIKNICIKKPFTPEELLQSIDEVIKGSLYETNINNR